MKELICMVGLQGSGKSFTAEYLAEGSNGVVLSSDYLRKMYPEKNNEEIFKELYSSANHLLETCCVIIDATAITIKSRKKIFENIKTPCKKIAYIVNTPYEVCKQRVIERNKDTNSHQVPLDVLDRYHLSFEVPFKEEGWDEIIVHDDIEQKSLSLEDDAYQLDLDDATLDLMNKFNQNNQYHSETLGCHSNTVFNGVFEYLLEKNSKDPLYYSSEDGAFLQGCFLHDVGKLWTQSYKGEDLNAHYYNHANIGAYWKLCNGWSAEEVFYENYHMILQNELKDQTREKYKKLFGEDKYNNLCILKEMDSKRGDI